MNFSRIATAAAYQPFLPQQEVSSQKSSFSEWSDRAWAKDGNAISAKALDALTSTPAPEGATAFWNQWPDKAWR